MFSLVSSKFLAMPNITLYSVSNILEKHKHMYFTSQLKSALHLVKGSLFQVQICSFLGSTKLLVRCINTISVLSITTPSIRNTFVFTTTFPPARGTTWKKTNKNITDKRTDVWSRDFMTWKINSGLWAVALAGLWEKMVWANYEQLLRLVFSLFQGQKKFSKIFENTIASALKSYIIIL